MMRRVRYLLWLLLVALVLAAVAGGWYWLHSGNPDALRQIVLQQCVPNQQQHQTPSPCAEVNLKGGYVLFKDRNGPLQYLLMPTYRINGTESPLLLNPLTPNFFWQAWQGREIMSQRRGSRFRITPYRWRSTRAADARKTISIFISPACAPMCARSWIRMPRDQQPLAAASGGLQGHEYLARRVTEANWPSVARS
jgi:CDP-diacylglycerol pyrophosphatase